MASYAVVIIIIATFISSSNAEIRFSKIQSDSNSRRIILLDQFGFTNNGRLELNVTNLSFSSLSTDTLVDLSKLGFLILNSNSWFREQIVDEKKISCSLPLNFTKQVYNMNSLTKGATSFNHSYIQSHADDQYMLVFANCLPRDIDVKISMDILSGMYNLNDKSNTRGYLSVGMNIIPRVYFLFAIVYYSMALYWLYLLYEKRSNLFGVHLIMLAVLILKTFTLVFQGKDKWYINRTGSPHGCDIMFYIFSFLYKITFLSSIVLIGSGWDFVKLYLQGRDKKVLMIVIPLQVVAGILCVVMDKSGSFYGPNIWVSQLFLVVNAVSYFVVLLPIIWTTGDLEDAAIRDGKAPISSMKYNLFSTYFIVVLLYVICFPSIMVSFEAIASYKYLWISVVVTEITNIAFYVFNGYSFKPEGNNPYLPL